MNFEFTCRRAKTALSKEERLFTIKTGFGGELDGRILNSDLAVWPETDVKITKKIQNVKCKFTFGYYMMFVNCIIHV